MKFKRRQKRLSKIFAIVILVLLLTAPLSSFAQPAALAAPQAHSDCWSKSDCMQQEAVKGCPVEACFEEDKIVCGEGRGYCYARPVPLALTITLGGLTQVHDPAQYISKLYEWGVSITGILAGIMIMIGGLLYLTAGGSAERVSNAKSYISNALIGLVLAMTSYLLLQTVNPALLGLKFPKVRLIRPATPPEHFCEDLLTASEDIEVTPVEPGKTACGDLGVPKSKSGQTANLPTTCMYGICQDPEKACLPRIDPGVTEKPAGCFTCAGLRLDASLAGISTGPGSTDIQTPRRAFGQTTCDSLTPLPKDSTIYTCEFLDTPAALGQGPMDTFMKFCSDFGTGVMVADLGRGLALRTARKLAPSIARGRLGTLGEAFTQSRAAVRTGNIAMGTAGVAELVEAAGEFINIETATDIGETVSTLAECSYGAITAFANPITGIVGGTYAALKEFFTVVLPASTNPGAFFGEEGVCAVAALDCSKIKSCRDYEDIVLKGNGTTTLKEVVGQTFGTSGFLTDEVDLTRTFCINDPCQLPLFCAPAQQLDYNWDPDRGRPSPIVLDRVGGPSDFKCLPIEMIGTYGEHDKYSNLYSPASIETGKKLSQREGITLDKIYPVVRPFTARAQQKGQLCRTDADCAPGLSCRGESVLYKDVKEITEAGNIWEVIRDQDPKEITFQRCW